MTDIPLDDKILSLAKRAGLLTVSERFDDSDIFHVDTGSPALNRVLGSEEGIPTGRIIEIFGPESVGKSALAYKLMSIYQEVGGHSVLADIAQDYSEGWGASIGIDNEKLLLLYLDEAVDKKTGEIVLEGLEDLLRKMVTIINMFKAECPEDPLLIVWDDIAQTPTKKELEGEFGSDAPALLASSLSKGLKKLYSHMHGSSCTLLCINQVRMKIGWVSYEEAPGGRAPKFYSSVRAKIRRKSKSSTKSGAIINSVIENVKNKVSAPFCSSEFTVSAKTGVVLK